MRRAHLVPYGSLLLLAATVAACGAPITRGAVARTGDTMNQPHEAQAARASLEALLRRYESALNTSDAAAAVGVYADDAVFMAQHRAPAVGRAAIRQAYDEIFAAIQLNVTFGIDEIELVGDTAWARTHSRGETEIRANGARVPERNSELFIFQKQGDGGWRVVRYLFATQNPPR